MANSSNSNNNNKQKKTKSSGGGSSWSLNKVSFYALCVVAFMYLLAMIFSLVKVAALATAATIIQNIATAVVICVAAVNAWRFVKGKQTVWKVLYALVLLIILVGIVVPLVV